MVVAGILALALALPTGALFGIGYGTGVRIGYEQIYPLLFPANEKGERNTSSTVENVNAINKIYNAIGGKEASQMGMAVGLSNVMSELDTNPDFQALLKLESTESGSTPSHLDSHQKTLEQILLSLSQASPFNTEEIKGHTNTPGGFLLNPIIQIPFEEGPENITDKFGYGAMTRTELLNNQPSQLSQKPSNLAERQINWQHYYDIALADHLQQAKPISETQTTPKSTSQQVQETYVVKRAALLTTIYQTNSEIKIAQANKDSAFSQNLNSAMHWSREVASLITRKEREKKLLINHITLARNVLITKSLANNDWNKRIWNV